MRAIVINPFTHTISECDIGRDFMTSVRDIIGAPALALQTIPGTTALFIDAMGFLQPSAYWRTRDDKGPEQNIAGVSVMFGLWPDGKLRSVPPEMSIEAVAEMVVWTDDAVDRLVERLAIVEQDTPVGKVALPIVHRTVMWLPGTVMPASTKARAPLPVDEPDIYMAPALPPAAPPMTEPDAEAATGRARRKRPPVASPSTTAPRDSDGLIYAIRETDDNQVQLLAYEVVNSKPMLRSMTTYPNIEAARKPIPRGFECTIPPDDSEDDALIETWS